MVWPGIASRVVLVAMVCGAPMGCGSERESAATAVGGALGIGGAVTDVGGSTSASGGAGTAAGGGAGVAGAQAAGGSWTASCADAPPEDGFEEVPSSDPAIRYVGRVETLEASVRFAFPAVQIQTKFQGDAIDMRLRDSGRGTLTGTNFYAVMVDDAAAITIETCPEREVYPLARGLTEGEHTLTIVKRTESGPGGNANVGKGEFLGFRVRPGTVLSAVTPPSRRMEFVGDSITCGYGIEVSTQDPDSFPFTAVNENAWLAYGAVTARILSSDYVAVAASGRGVIRNYNGFAGATVPEMYEMTLPEETGAIAWDHSRYEPDVVVVNLGTNDFSIGLELADLEAHRTAFRAGYATFLGRIREVHPAATVVVTLGPMMSDDYPPGYKAWTSIQEDLNAVITERQAGGDTDTHLFVFDQQQSPHGEDWHPTSATQQGMADALAPFIAGLMGW